MATLHHVNLVKNVARLDQAFLSFKSRPMGNYTPRQLTMAAAYTVFCHAEIETFLETWAKEFVDFADAQWKNGKATRILVHLCTFHEGRSNLNSVPAKDIWNEVIWKVFNKHRAVIRGNHGIKESNFCELFSPIGLNTTLVDNVLLNDLTAFGTLRGDHAHNSHIATIGTTFDPFDRKNKVQGILNLLSVLDGQLDHLLKSS